MSEHLLNPRAQHFTPTAAVQQQQESKDKKRKKRLSKRNRKGENGNHDQQREDSQNKGPDRQKRTKTGSEEPQSFLEQLRHCANRKQHTASIFMDFSDDLQRDSHSMGEISEVRIVSSCRAGEIDQAQQDKTNDTNRISIYVKPLLILDINGVLCHRVRHDREEKHPDFAYRPSASRIAGTHIVPRVGLPSFLHYLDAHFTLAVWTSAKRRTANQLISQLMPQHISKKLLFVWAQHNCDWQHHPTSTRPLFFKPLGNVWERYPLWNASNTLLLDDSPEKCLEEFRWNALHPPPLHGKDLSGNDVHDGGSRQPGSDEENEAIQMNFFIELVNHFGPPRSTLCSDDQNCQEAAFGLLVDFLRLKGRGHMGWNEPGKWSPGSS